MKIVSISGSQGTGKTTFMQSLLDKYKVHQFSMSRDAQKRLGWDRLSLAEESVENMILLQDEILNSCISRDTQLKSITPETSTVLVERSPADIWAYTELWCSRNGLDKTSFDWAIHYRRRLIEHYNLFYSGSVVLPINNHIKFVTDPNRADLASRQSVERSIIRFLELDTSAPYNILGNFPSKWKNEVDKILGG